MMLLYIKILCKQKRLELSYLAEKTGMSTDELQACINKNEMDAITLERIAHILNVPVGRFYNKEPKQISNSVVGNNNILVDGSANVVMSKNELEFKVHNLELRKLYNIIMEKDRMIAEKDRMIAMLMKT